MSYPGIAQYPGTDVYGVNDIFPGGLVYPGVDAFPDVPGDAGASSAPTPGTGLGAGPPAAYASPGGELQIVLRPDTTPPRADVEVGWAGATVATVSRIDPDGSTWPVLGGNQVTLDVAGGVYLTDAEVPYGVPVTYQITSPQKPGLTVRVITGTLDVSAAWSVALVHPVAPTLSVPVRLYRGSMDKVTRRARQASLTILGRRRPIVVSDVRESRSSELVVWTQSVAEVNALEGVVADGSALRLACDPRRFASPLPQMFVAVGDIEITRLPNDPGILPDRLVTLSFVEVDRPAAPQAGTSTGGGGGGTGAGFWTYAVLDSTFSNRKYTDLDGTYATYSDLDLNRAS